MIENPNQSPKQRKNVKIDKKTEKYYLMPIHFDDEHLIC